MSKKVIISESQLRLFENLNSEEKDDLKLYQFERYMNKLGFLSREGGRGSAKMFYHPDYNNCKVLVDAHGPNDRVHGDSLKHTTEELEKVGWFNIKGNFDRYYWDEWQIPKGTKNRIFNSIDTTKEDIEKANKLYKDAEIKQVFYGTKNPLSFLIVGKEQVNLCRSKIDRRPLLDGWFNDYEYKSDGKPYIKRDNYETFETESYPVNADGTIDTNNVIIENKKYDKKRIS
jgi:hypothetical protein